jgi:hypothetical protein
MDTYLSLPLIQKGLRQKLAQGNAEFKFAPRNGTQFYVQYGWKEIQFRSFVTEGIRIKRYPPMGWAWPIFSNIIPMKLRKTIERTAGIALFQKKLT